MKKPIFFGMLSLFVPLFLLSTPQLTQATGQLSPSLSTISVSTNNLEANYQNQANVYVYAKDASNIHLPGKKVVLSSTIAGTVFSPDTVYTDGNSYAQFSVKSSRVGNAQITAYIEDTAINQKAQINFYYSGAAVSSTYSAVIAYKTNALANGTDTVTVTATAKDSFGNPLGGKGVTFFWTVNGSPSVSSAITDNQGKATIIFAPTTPQTITAYAEIGGVILNQVTIYFTNSGNSTTVSAAQSSLMTTPSSLIANGSNYASVTATVKNSSGAPLVGKMVTFTTVLNGQQSVLQYNTNSEGKANYSVQAFTPGTASISAVVDGITIGQTTIQYLSPSSNTVSLSQSTVFVAPSTVALNGGTITVTVYARNEANQPLGGRPVRVTSNIAFNANPSSINTNTDGVASYSLKPLGPGSMGLTIYVDGIALNQKPVVQVLPSIMNCPVSTGSLVKLQDDGNPATQEDSAVYYISSDCKRHAFSNVRVYYSWFSNFNNIQTIGNGMMASIPLGKNNTYRPGAKMIKFPSVPKVYMVAKGGVLHWVPTEWVATQYFGTDWKNKIEDVSEAFYNDYSFGADIFNTWEYNVGNEYNTASLEN